MPSRHRRSFDEWRKWRLKHYPDGSLRDDELGHLMAQLLSTRRGARALRAAELRYERLRRRGKHPAGMNDADYLHRAYGRRHGYGR